MSVKSHGYCRICDTPLAAPYLDLGCQPLANALFNPADIEYNETALGRARVIAERVAPLAIALCKNCGLSQLTVVVDPSVLYSGYRFRSGASAEWKSHCETLARSATETFKRPGWVLDIAANDATQLAAFHERGWNTVGVEPADIAPVKHVGRLERKFWSIDVARKLRKEHQAFDLVIAQNVLGHVDDCVGFLSAVEHVLAPDGLCAVEVPHVRDMILSVAFDTIYHEHVSYWCTAAMSRAAKRAGLVIHRTEVLKQMHGGSRRYWLRRGGAPDAHPALLLEMNDIAYRRFANDVERKLLETIRLLRRLKDEGRRIWAYGASAKGSVMLNALKDRGNTIWPDVIVDDVKEKQGMLSPGLHIPILDPSELQMSEARDVCWVLSWNLRNELKARARACGFKGEFMFTMPQVGLEN